MKISVPFKTNFIVDENGFMTNQFNTFIIAISDLAIEEGAGSPEGVVAARTTKLYMDTTGAPGSILYIKQLSDIGGDVTKGWNLV